MDTQTRKLYNTDALIFFIHVICRFLKNTQKPQKLEKMALTVAIIWLPTTMWGMDASNCTASAAILANNSLQNNTFWAASSFCCQWSSAPSPGNVPGQFSAEELSVAVTTSSCSAIVYHYLYRIYLVRWPSSIIYL